MDDFTRSADDLICSLGVAISDLPQESYDYSKSKIVSALKKQDRDEELNPTVNTNELTESLGSVITSLPTTSQTVCKRRINAALHKQAVQSRHKRALKLANKKTVIANAENTFHAEESCC